MSVLASESVGLVIDIQEKLLPHIHAHEEVLQNSRLLLDGLIALDIDIIVTEQYKKGLGETEPVIVERTQSATFFEKKAFSCCDDQDFLNALHNTGKKFVIIAGIESHVCVLQTAIDLLAAGYQPVIVADCTSSRKERDYMLAIERMRQEGAIITSYESILFELARISGTNQFKTISKLVK